MARKYKFLYFIIRQNMRSGLFVFVNVLKWYSIQGGCSSPLCNLINARPCILMKSGSAKFVVWHSFFGNKYSARSEQHISQLYEIYKEGR